MREKELWITPRFWYEQPKELSQLRWGGLEYNRLKKKENNFCMWTICNVKSGDTWTVIYPQTVIE